MPSHQQKYYCRDEDVPKELASLYAGFDILQRHPLFSQLNGTIESKTSHLTGKRAIACVTKSGEIFVNDAYGLQASEWAYVLAHNLLHLAFGHFDQEKMPRTAQAYPLVWNKACDIYVTRFLADVDFGKTLFADPASEYTIKLNDEAKIYEYLLEKEGTIPKQDYGLNTSDAKDMIGVESPIVYKNGDKNAYAEAFSYAITHSMKKAVIEVGGHDFSKKKDTVITKAAEWFLAHYPLLGGLAASFKIIEDIDICHKNEIHIAAVDATHGEIYANPSCDCIKLL